MGIFSEAKKRRLAIKAEMTAFRDQDTINFKSKIFGNGIYPGRDEVGAYTGDFGIGAKAAKEASAGQLFKRAGIFATGGSGYKRELLANSFGFISKQQAAQKGLMNFFTNKMLIPATALFSLYDSAKSGDISDFFVNSSFGIGAGIGGRIGQSLALGAGRAIGFETLGLRMLGGLGLGVGGLAVGALVAGTVSLGASFNDSNNLLARTADKMRYSSLVNDFTQTDTTLTHRQRALEQISKSALNNRGQLLGNEASILAGAM